MTTTSTQNEVWSPPYASFVTLLNTAARMAEQGVPSRIDRSYLSHMPGSVRATFLGTLRSLSLIDETAQPTQLLLSLVEAMDDVAKAEAVASIVLQHYEQVLILPKNATQAQLEDAFREYGITGSTLRKAIAFYLAAAKYAGIPLSPHFRVPKDPATGEQRPRVRRARVVQQPAAATTPVAHAVVPASATSGAAQHPLIAGLIRELPEPGELFPPEKQDAWFTIAKATFQLLYRTEGGPQATARHVSDSITGGQNN